MSETAEQTPQDDVESQKIEEVKLEDPNEDPDDKNKRNFELSMWARVWQFFAAVCILFSIYSIVSAYTSSDVYWEEPSEDPPPVDGNTTATVDGSSSTVSLNGQEVDYNVWIRILAALFAIPASLMVCYFQIALEDTGGTYSSPMTNCKILSFSF